MIVDSHIHLYPPRVYENPRSWALERREDYWLSCVAPETGRSLQAWKSADELLRDMDDAQVDRAIVLAWYWQSQDTCLENVHWQIEWIKAHPNRLIAFAPFNSKGGKAAIELLKLAFDSGFKGIGELNPPAQGYDYDDPTLAEALDLAASYGAAVNFHVTDPTTHDYPGKIDTPFKYLLELAHRHPKTQFVLAHLGGCEPLRIDETLPANVVFDTAVCPLLYKKPVYREFCDKVGVDNVLFGSDYPLRTFPKNASSPNFSLPLEELRNGGLTHSELEKISGLNAARIFNL